MSLLNFYCKTLRLQFFIFLFIYLLSGGGGQRKLSLIPMDADGYSGLQLRSASNNGKIVLFLVPLQEDMDTEPLPFDAAEFSRMP